MAVKDMSVSASPPIFNPSQIDECLFAEYRADAIARDIEQRRDEHRDPHIHHQQIVGEAMAYAYMLLAAGRWTMEQVKKLELRLSGEK